MLAIASTLLFIAVQAGPANARVELNANWETPTCSLPTIRCGDREKVMIKITSGPLSGMEMDMTPSLKGHAFCVLSVNFLGEKISTLLPGNHMHLQFSWNGKHLDVLTQMGKTRNAKIMSLPFWKELNGDVLSIDFEQAS